MTKTPTRIAMIAALAAAFLAAGGKDRGPTNGTGPETARGTEVSTGAAGPVANVQNVQLASSFPVPR